MIPNTLISLCKATRSSRQPSWCLSLPCCPPSSLMPAIREERDKGQSLLPFTSFLRSFQARTSAYKSLTRNMSHGLPAQQGGLGSSVCWLDADRELPEEGLPIKQKSRQIVVSASGWFRGSDPRPRTGLRLCLCLSHVGFMLTQASPCDLRQAAATLDLASTPSPAQEERPDPRLQAWLPPHAPP